MIATTMKALMWKDYRANRAIIIAVVVAIVLPYCLTIGVAWYLHHREDSSHYYMNREIVTASVWYGTALMRAMRREELAPPEHVESLRKELNRMHKTAIFDSCRTMGDLTASHLTLRLSNQGGK